MYSHCCRQQLKLRKDKRSQQWSLIVGQLLAQSGVELVLTGTTQFDGHLFPQESDDVPILVVVILLVPDGPARPHQADQLGHVHLAHYKRR